jgi:hypothetical protein
MPLAGLLQVTSAAWLTPTGPHKQCQLLAGMDDGQIYVFKVGQAMLTLSPPCQASC